MLPNLPGIMLWVWTMSHPLSWRRGAWFVSDDGILVEDEGIFTKFSASTKEFLLTVKEFLPNSHQKYEGIEYS